MSVTSTKFSDDFQSIVKTNAKCIAVITPSEEKVTYANLEKRVSQMEEFLSNFGFNNENVFDLTAKQLRNIIDLSCSQNGRNTLPQSIQSTPRKLKTCWPRLDLTLHWSPLMQAL